MTKLGAMGHNGGMNIAVNVEAGFVGGGLGRARTMAIAQVESGQIQRWTEYEVGWDVAHDAVDLTGSHGGHHATIVRFMREHHVEVVVTGHAGPPMVHTLDLMGIPVVVGATGPAQAAALAAAGSVDLG